MGDKKGGEKGKKKELTSSQETNFQPLSDGLMEAVQVPAWTSPLREAWSGEGTGDCCWEQMQ